MQTRYGSLLQMLPLLVSINVIAAFNSLLLLFSVLISSKAFK